MMLRLNLIDGAAVRRRRFLRLCRPAAGIGLTVAASWFALADAAVRETSREIDQRLAAAEARLQRARAMPVDGDAIESARAALEQRIAVLDAAARRETIAAVAFGVIAASLPAGAWLSELKLDGELLTIRGSAASAAAVAQLATRLDAAGLFAAPVEITGTEAVTDPARGDTVNFIVVGKLHG